MSIDRRELIHLLTFAAGSGIAGLDSPLAQATETVTSAESGQTTEKVLGIGGLFFRAKDPDSLGRWYKDQLGIEGNPIVVAAGRVRPLQHGFRSRGFLAIMKVYVET